MTETQIPHVSTDARLANGGEIEVKALDLDPDRKQRLADLPHPQDLWRAAEQGGVGIHPHSPDALPPAFPDQSAGVPPIIYNLSPYPQLPSSEDPQTAGTPYVPPTRVSEEAQNYIPPEKSRRLRSVMGVAKSALARVVAPVRSAFETTQYYPEPEIVDSSGLSGSEKNRRYQSLMSDNNNTTSRPQLPESRRYGIEGIGGVPTTQPGYREVRKSDGSGLERPDIRHIRPKSGDNRADGW